MGEFIGGMNVRTRLGRMNATWPLASLTLSASDLELGLRGPLRRISRRREARYDEIDQVQAVKGLASEGVRFRVRGETWYFWTFRLADVLAALRSHGLAVADERVKLRYFARDDWGR